ncbi:MAG: RNA polymerase factor sigma-54 [Candidatus Omnitrophota bacterium]|nr:RNA polymerase factor sigma-54 [Candidatus Omnitrophota bacterium]
MKNKLSQHQRFLQKMSLTPQMRQSLNILGMSVSDLAEYIDFAVTQNPFLKKLIDEKRSFDKYRGEISQIPDKTIKQDEDPRHALLSQIKMSGLTDNMLEIAEYLIYEMDDNGYITIDLEEAAEDLGVDCEEVSECLCLIQEMEPAGIGAKDIKECLQLQLKRKGKGNSLEWRIVGSFLSEVAQENIEKIAKELKVDRAKVKEAVSSIKKLNPRPASTILAKESKNVIPELMAKVDEKKVRLELNRGSIPGLKLYNPYANDFDIIKDPQARKFMQENINAAKGLIDNLKRREDTMCKVADYILNFQRDAIYRDIHHIRSLTIKEVAHATNFHPSTISRVVSNKYIQLNDDVVPLKSLLSHGIKHVDGQLHSKTSIKKTIETLIKREDPSRPANDGEIHQVLKKVAGINISRRTVAKYRASMRILPAHLRKKVSKA